jgi:acylglycerol lipase
MVLRSGHQTIAAGDGTPLFVGYELPPRPRALLLLVHGIASHQGWYRGLARRLSSRGMAVFLPDRRGAGRSGGSRGHAESWRELLDDLRRVRAAALEEAGPIPVHGLGISLGGALLAAAEQEEPGRYASLILCAPGFKPGFAVPLWRRLRLLRRSWTSPGKLYELPFGVSEFTPDPRWQEALRGDPLWGEHASARFLVQLFRLQLHNLRKRRRLALPLLALLAGRDLVVDNARTERILAGARAPAVEIHRFPGAPHMLPAAVPAGLLVDIVARWVEDGHRTPGRRASTHEGDAAREPAPMPDVLELGVA